MAGRSVLPKCGSSNDKELMDSGWSSSDNLTNVTSSGNLTNVTSSVDRSSTTSYPASTISTRSNISRTMSRSTTMDSLTTVYDMSSTLSNISMAPIYEVRAPSLMSCDSYTGVYLLTKDYDNRNVSMDSVVCDLSTTAPEDMFPPYQSNYPQIEEVDFKKGSKSEFGIFI
jgi:hypothetical protein